MPQLHTFRNDLSLSDFSGSLLALSPSLLPRWKASLIRAGILTPEHQTASDLELAGTLLSALSEAELLTFLKKNLMPGNYRNGYVRRCFHFPQGNTVARIARDRSGLFESHLLPRYRGHVATHVEDLIATAVVTGYSPQEKLQLLSAFVRRENGDPKTLKGLLPLFSRCAEQWLADKIPACVRLAVGWEKTVYHSCGLCKRIAGIRVLADDAQTLLGVRAVACAVDSDEDLAFPLIEACGRIHGLSAPATFTTVGSVRSRFSEAAARHWPGSLQF